MARETWWRGRRPPVPSGKVDPPEEAVTGAPLRPGRPSARSIAEMRNRGADAVIRPSASTGRHQQILLVELAERFLRDLKLLDSLCLFHCFFLSLRAIDKSTLLLTEDTESVREKRRLVSRRRALRLDSSQESKFSILSGDGRGIGAPHTRSAAPGVVLGDSRSAPPSRGRTGHGRTPPGSAGSPPATESCPRS